MDKPPPTPDLSAAARASVGDWESEGGHPLPPPDDGPLLQRLGAALVGEWNNLPTALQRAIYDRAVADGGDDGGGLKRLVARFLHEHKSPPAP